MVKRNYTTDEKEPEESKFDLPSEKEHLLQVTDVTPVEGNDDISVVKLEVVGGEEEGRTLLNRVNIDQSLKSFFYARLFLKAIGEPYKGQFDIDTDRWSGRQFYATVVHNGKYANIGEYNFDKKIEQQYKATVKLADDKLKEFQDIAWND